ncbi:NAD(P)-dependent oxidoreductase, partial [uncultured Cohaesibacter sp.]|uniref:NAD-dependent epimerase/dehydratase family protein n=1 Tax=uncultured Cohaesibacter sp. TaxID=1002546 RepID=UPI002AAACA81
MVPQTDEIWRLSDIKPLPEPVSDNIECFIGDLTDFDFAMRLCEDVDAIIHLAGQPKEGSWDWLMKPNVICSANLWEAASRQGVRQIIYGSSNHVYGMYPTSHTLRGDEPLRPDSRYGVT